MDSTSIISFNNDSTLQNTVKTDYNINVHELALHAMRDRCLLLQKRINSLESDNMRLKLDSAKTDCTPFVEDNERFLLNKKIAELTKQKSQLLHHVFMVSCENKNLWNKISSLNRPDKLPKGLLKHHFLKSNNAHSTPRGSVDYNEKYGESSLEEISLKLINSYIQEKSQLVEQYEQMNQLQHSDNESKINLDSIGFAYIEEPATDSLKDIQNQTLKLDNMKKDLAKQENDLKLIINQVEAIVKEGYRCPSCATRNIKTSSEHKEIETSDSLANFATPVDSNNFNNFSELNNTNNKVFKNDNEDNVEKATVDPNDKICPMCGHTYEKEVDFTEFQSHVESHFTGEIDLSSVIENYNTIDNIPDSVDLI